MNFLHADYPHEPGTLYDCAACETYCYCNQLDDDPCVACAISYPEEEPDPDAAYEAYRDAQLGM